MVNITPEQRAGIRQIALRHGGSRVGLFGSCARGLDRPESDVDLLIDLQPTRTLLSQIAIQQEVQKLLGRPVDVVVESGLSPYLRDAILAEAVPL